MTRQQSDRQIQTEYMVGILALTVGMMYVRVRPWKKLGNSLGIVTGFAVCEDGQRWKRGKRRRSW